jgi:hypothetical protein
LRWLLLWIVYELKATIPANRLTRVILCSASGTLDHLLHLKLPTLSHLNYIVCSLQNIIVLEYKQIKELEITDIMKMPREGLEPTLQ